MQFRLFHGNVNYTNTVMSLLGSIQAVNILCRNMSMPHEEAHIYLLVSVTMSQSIKINSTTIEI